MKTPTEFWTVADIWYQRTHNLREVWQSNDVDPVKKEKAFGLFMTMFIRMQKVSMQAMKISQPKMPTQYNKGGFCTANEARVEFNEDAKLDNLFRD